MNSLAMYELQKQNKFTDVVFVLGDNVTRIPAHRAVLAAQSDFFCTMFESGLHQSTKQEGNEIPLYNINKEDLENFIKYFYTGVIDICEENVENILTSAHQYLLEDVVNKCCDFLLNQIHHTNCLGFWNIGKLSKKLAKKAKGYACCYFMNVRHSEEFLQLDIKKLLELLGDDTLIVSQELDVYHSMNAWLNYNESGRQQYIGNLLQKVRSNYLPGSFDLPANQIANSRKEPKTIFAVATRLEHENIPILKYCEDQNKWNVWTEIATEWKLEELRDYGILMYNNQVIIAGGSVWSPVNTVFSFHFQTKTTRSLSPMKKSRSQFVLVELYNHIYAIGGVGSSGYESSVERWNRNSDSWTEVASLNVARSKHSAAVLNGYIYVVGMASDAIGRRQLYSMHTVEKFDPRANRWTRRASVSLLTEGTPTIAVLNNQLYAIRGDTLNKTVEHYNYKLDVWTKICTLEMQIFNTGCSALNGRFLASSDCKELMREEYDPVESVKTINREEKDYAFVIVKGLL